MRAALAGYAGERTITLLALSVSHLKKQPEIQRDLPFGLPTKTADLVPEKALPAEPLVAS
ncbi:hypothetical protein [Mesorhizobium helmanticense]|uniref:hypothetical protein n=1 Tax=Mesorhizobium helmanticense TaxID=1776423 RepID=UPI001FE1DC39|nr:hypothetical protein [Mesorhizobium helmanticense]